MPENILHHTTFESHQSLTLNPGPQLPIELLQPILSALATDPDTVKACALVCRAWLTDTRRVLFCHVKLREPADYNQAVKTLQTSPEIRDYIKHLTVKIYNDYQRVQRTENAQVCYFLHNHAPQSLESLEVDVYEYEYEPNEDLISALYTYPARFPDLKTFIARVSLLRTSRSHKITWLRKAVSNLTRSIEEIIIKVPAEGTYMFFDPEFLVWQWDRIDWNEIDQIINVDRFPHLKRVYVIFEIRCNYTLQLKEWVEVQFSQLQLLRTGLLEIVSRESGEPRPSILRAPAPDIEDEHPIPRSGCFSRCVLQ